MTNQDRISTFSAGEGYQILAGELAAFRALSYQELANFVGPAVSRRIKGNSAVECILEVNVRWKYDINEDIIVEGWIAVDDCGPMRRLNDYFIVKPPASS